jgi:uncharacterized damage-inducible protein DinB
MSLAQQAIMTLDSAREFFNRSTRNLTEAQATYAPADGMMTTAQHVAHVAQTIDWFVEGAFRPGGFAMDWEEQARIVAAVESLEQARAWFERAIAGAGRKVASLGDEALLAPMAEGPIMGGAPRFAIFSAITDHTAHHRGALTIYARLNGIVPPMPYMEM